MSKIPSVLELELQALAPSALEESFLSRLTACAEDSFCETSLAEASYEAQLREIMPRTLQAGVQERLLEAIGDAPFAVDGKILLFNRPKKASNGEDRYHFSRFSLAAAAAVALLGAITALMIPAAGTPPGRAAMAAIPARSVDVISAPAPASSNIAPAGFNRNIRETSDEGVFWQDGGQLYRHYRQTYTDRFTTENEKGETVELQQPHVEHVLIPENID